MMGLYGGGINGGVGIVMGLFWIALIGAIIWLVVRLSPTSAHARSKIAGPAGPRSGPESPTELLDRRFAVGEINLDTYQTHRTALLATWGEK
jgi:putative membrane protein